MATRRGRRQLQFSGFEMAMIAVSFVVTVTAVFFLGLFVGKKNASYHAPREDRVARVPVEDFSRYARPAASTPAAKPPADAVATSRPAEPAAAAPDVRRPAPPPAKDAGAAPDPSHAPEAKAAAATTPAKPAAPSEAHAAAGTKAATEAEAKEKAAAEAKARADADAKAKAKADADAKAKAAADEAGSGRGYTVQVLATRKQADADALVRKLKARGYEAYIRKVSDGENAWYRVRVGSYGGFSDARGMADRLRRDLELEQAFVSTE